MSKLLKVVIGVLLLAWLIGLASGHTLGGFLHVLLVLALLLWMITLVRGGNLL